MRALRSGGEWREIDKKKVAAREWHSVGLSHKVVSFVLRREMQRLAVNAECHVARARLLEKFLTNVINAI